jgi:hypothetical protein
MLLYQYAIIFRFAIHSYVIHSFTISLIHSFTNSYFHSFLCFFLATPYAAKSLKLNVYHAYDAKNVGKESLIHSFIHFFFHVFVFSIPTSVCG